MGLVLSSEFEIEYFSLELTGFQLVSILLHELDEVGGPESFPKLLLYVVDAVEDVRIPLILITDGHIIKHLGLYLVEGLDDVFAHSGGSAVARFGLLAVDLSEPSNMLINSYSAIVRHTLEAFIIPF